MSVDTSNATPLGAAASALEAVRTRIAGAIKDAANTTGASFEYLLTAAKMESDFNPSAGASTSSARGLYQFIDQTWLATVKEAGAQFGYGKYADAITKTPSGEYTVSDPAARQAIMKLRDDPTAASAMAGSLTQSNSFKLTGMIGRRPTDGELYMAHFMGVNGAAKLIQSAEEDPQASAARVFPGPAAANRPIFYDRSGRARSVSEVYADLTSRYAAANGSSATQTALAMYGQAGGSAAPMDSATYLSTFPNAHSANSASGGGAAEPTFRSLFQVDDSHPVSPTVRALWGKSNAVTAAANPSSEAPVRQAQAPQAQAPLALAPQVPSSQAQQAAQGQAPQPFNLFSDPNGTFSG